MGRNNYFQFKQFKIVQQKAAMKVGTDGVLLGAWAEVHRAKTVLDIGSGTGVIALMLAQRTKADITGIEIEKNASAEASENAKNSPWSHRIEIRNSSFQEFAEITKNTFDLIVSNPPFFIDSQRTTDPNRAIARHNHLLPLPDLSDGVSKLLSSEGYFSLILPVEPAEQFIALAIQRNLFLCRLTELKSNAHKPTHRYLMEFAKSPQKVENNCLTIYENDGSDFTKEYKLLTRDFYLNF